MKTILTSRQLVQVICQLLLVFLCASLMGYTEEAPTRTNLPEQTPFTIDFTPIACGETVNGNTLGQPNNLSGYVCFGERSSYSAGDDLFLLELDEARGVAIQLNNTGDANLDLFILEAGTDPVTQELVPGGCIGKSTLPISEPDIIYLNLLKGIYFIVVDGRPNIFNPTVSDEGPFELEVNCFPLPTLCDFAGYLIQPGNVVYSRAGLQLGVGSFRQATLPPYYTYAIPCVQNTFSSGAPLFANVYTYYHDGETDAFSLDIQSEDDNLYAFVLACASGVEQPVCLGAVRNGELSVEDAAIGFYKILVATEDKNKADYRLAVLPAGPCLQEDQFEMRSSEGTLAGGGNDYEAVFYRSCYTGERSYAGEDKVFYFEINDLDDDDPRSSIQRNFQLESAAPLGVFLYDYQCGGRCLGYWETDGTESARWSYVFTQNGSYYFIVDQAEPGMSGDFKFILPPSKPRVGSSCGNFTPPSSHEITFSESSATFLNASDRVIADYVRSDTISYYLRKGVAWSDEEERLLDVTLVPDHGERRQKCGYSEGEEILFFALKEDGTYLELQAEYAPLNPPLVTAINRYQFNGRSQVLKFTPVSVRNAGTLRITPKLVEDLNFQAVTLQAILISDGSWEINKDPETEWYSVRPLQGEENEVITIDIAQNMADSVRIDSFEILGAAHLRTFTLSQQPSTCHLNPLELFIDSLDNEVVDREGFIAISVDGGSPPFLYEWRDEQDRLVSEEQDVAGIGPGVYSLVVEDTQGCTAELTGLAVTMSTTAAHSPINDHRLHVYPNPAHDRLYLQIDIPSARRLTVEVFNTWGQKLLQKQLEGGNRSWPLDVAGFPPGLYWVKAQIGHTAVWQKVIVVK